jgi:hypothetical protein
MMKKNWFHNTAFSNWKRVSHAYVEFRTDRPLSADHVVHHRDENVINDAWNNLEVMTISEHNRLHRTGEQNPMRQMSKAKRIAKARRHSQVIKKLWREGKYSNRPEQLRNALGRFNHKIIAIEEHGYEDVYDFTVPINHNAVIGTGVLTHNCNVGVAFNVRDGFLDMTVFNRSNDMLWGALGANYVHFGFLQEYVAALCKLSVGKLTQISSNFHVYLDFEVTKRLMGKVQPAEPNPYEIGETVPSSVPILASDRDATWQSDALQFIERFTRDRPLKSYTWHEPFFETVAVPMFCAWHAWTCDLSSYDALGHLERSGEPGGEDWKLAAIQWIKRRSKQ